MMECGADNVARPTGALSTCEMRRSAVWAVNDQEECTIARGYVEIRTSTYCTPVGSWRARCEE